jgi:predicted GNAT superfamily acetyltransferase
MIVIRPCEDFDELQACVRLQVETWGYEASDVVPRKLYLVAQKIGGQVLGAFDTVLEAKKDSGVYIEQERRGGPESMVGFLLALPGVKSEEGRAEPYLHSHMLAVLESYRNRGLGAQLKRHQRLEALKRGINLIEWTFDPLEIKNAFLNIHKLGAIVRRYEVDFYGVSSSRLQGGLPTDRLVAEWRLDSPRVDAALDGHPVDSYAVADEIVVPAAISAWKASEALREHALAAQLENRRRFLHAFSHGLAIAGFYRDEAGNGIFQLAEYQSIHSSFQGFHKYEH